MVTDQQRVEVVKMVLRRDADASGYGRFVTDDWIAKLAADVVAELRGLESGRTI